MENIIRLDSSNPQKLVLTKNESAWIELSHVSNELQEYTTANFHTMFALHPEEKGKVIMFTTEVDAHRWYRSYMNTPLLDKGNLDHSYMFSGYHDGGDFPLPDEFTKFLDFMNSNDEKYNQVVVNWYETGNDYIPYHTDYSQTMSETPISILTLTETDIHPRIFCIKSKTTTMDKLYDKIEIPCINGLIIKLCGKTNDLFKHGVPKVPIGEKRISLSFREYL